MQFVPTETQVRNDSPSGSRPAIRRIELDAEVAAQFGALAARVAAEVSDDLTPSDLRHVAVMAHELPLDLRRALVDFRLAEVSEGGLVVSGLIVLDDALGPTPEVAQTAASSTELKRASIAQLLIASLLGDPFSHTSIQDGSLVLDICPVAGNEDTQLASSSLGGLTWHNEDAFHDSRADWLLLMCLRNHQRVATTFASVDDVRLSDEVREILFEPLYPIMPDSSHLSSAETPLPQLISVFTGPRVAPFVRIDPEFMDRELANKTAEKALLTLIDELDSHLQEIALEPGDFLIVDNLRAVHGRRPFEPNYDGNDRWLRVVNVTADLRKTATIQTRSNNRLLRHGRALRIQGVAGPTVVACP